MHSVFFPASPQARMVGSLSWWMFGVGLIIWLSVAALAIYAAKRSSTAPDTPRRERFIAAGVLTSGVVLAVFLVYDFRVGRALAQHPDVALTIAVTGHQWWWEVLYEDPDPSRIVSTANEIHVPVGRPVQFKLRAADVIHSLWAPNLNGKKDLIPGYTTTLWFQADTPGVYRGQCAEFCGLQHAQMAFYIIAEPPVKFAAWMAAASIPSEPPTDPTLRYGRQVFMTRGCALCHSISGTEARGSVGPGLSHFKSRASIAAGTLSNTRENLTRWIRNPAAVKPGVRMPAIPLAQSELAALVAYLETLK